MIAAIDGRLANRTERVGVGRYCAEVLRALPEAAPDLALRVYLDAPPRGDFPLTPARAEFRVLPPARGWTQRRLGPALRGDRPDVFYTPTLQMPLGCGCPVVATVHDVASTRFPEHFTPAQRLTAWLRLRQALLTAAHLVCDSGSARDDLLGLCRLSPERASVAFAGCAPEFTAPPAPGEAATVRERLRLPERYVLYVGRIQPRKNLPRLIAAFDALLARRPELPHHLLIAGGDGWLPESSHAAARAAAQAPRIRFAGHVPDDALPGLMRGADALALVSLWEGFGLPVLEAMSLGVPVVTSNCSSLPEVAGNAALLVDPLDTDAIADALETVLTDGARREECVRLGHAQAALFSWTATAESIARALRNAARRA
ncbi:MAG: glycosyltransferase family 4 protein [Candidatus Hydrogenedentes bacterium]|nr:glycosyltransferase family 4 protein [Candidatus Hydrogenedentota bacterium]